MSKADANRMMLMVSILARGKGKRYIDMIAEKNIRMNLQSVGHGTATSEMMDILGLGTNDKDVIISIAAQKDVSALLADMSKNLEGSVRYGGLLMVTKLSAMNRLAAEIITRSRTEGTGKEESRMTKGEGKFNLILIAVNEGFAEEVMKTAKKAGATGGTIIRARQAGEEMLEHVDIADVQEEKEIITILSPTTTCGAIMEEVNKEFGLRTPARGTVCAVPVERALKI
ncbi:MAG: hypothetical protein IJB84_01660 [Lachnospiraceae bacterium]|nr:hypothetical protein [Lachnospiraceae bacterium]